jgi:hypothetical protein
MVGFALFVNWNYCSVLYFNSGGGRIRQIVKELETMGNCEESVFHFRVRLLLPYF